MELILLPYYRLTENSLFVCLFLNREKCFTLEEPKKGQIELYSYIGNQGTKIF